MSGLRTGEVAKRASVHLETIRYYEQKGLLPKPPRSEAGYRCYPPDAVRRVQFVKRAQTGLTAASTKRCWSALVWGGTGN